MITHSLLPEVMVLAISTLVHTFKQDKSNQIARARTMESHKNRGQLFLVPTPLADGQLDPIPQINRSIVEKCRHFLVESFKMGRRHVKMMVPGFDFNEATFEELNKATDANEFESLLQPLFEGNSLCILSDAGSPVIADPGSNIVKLAHQRDIAVIPLAGPSSIMLALMGSGFGGQQFTFHGYLNRDKSKLKHDLKKLEHQAEAGYTQIFMETPYRNLSIFDLAMQTLHPSTQFCIACDLTAESAFIRTKSISKWNSEPKPTIHKRPCIFLLGK